MENNDIKKNILEKIQDGSIDMKPKYHFMLKTLTLSVGMLIVAVIALFVFSFILFTMRGSGLIYFSEFGGRGIVDFILRAPWLLIILILILVLLLEIMARHFAFIYRKPLLYSVLGILVLTTFAGSVIAVTPLHNKIHEGALGLPGAPRLYDHYGSPQQLRGGHVGVVARIDENGIDLQTVRGDIVFVSTSTRTRGMVTLEVGDEIMVAGRNKDGVFEVYGIREIDLESHPLMKRGLENRPPKERLEMK